MEEIKLKKFEEIKTTVSLPRGVKAIQVGNKIVFAKFIIGKFTQLPEEEQKKLREKYGI